MYCINCGVKLADTEKVCPLCRMPVPQGQEVTGKPLYPRESYPVQERKSRAYPVMMTVFCVLAVIVMVLCDLSGGRIGWCGYAIGGLLVAYVGFVLPSWFRRSNPVVFVPCFFAAVVAYLLYVQLATGGRWFLPFAFPVAGCVGLVISAAVTLLRYVRGGRLYIFGGTILALGGVVVLVEGLLAVAFSNMAFLGWSFYPLGALALLGGFLIFLGICRPARETMARKCFF